jgi:23S rRNA (cytosine1962-C5)-methyltransferase
VLAPPPFPDHALLDSGGGEKLERFGPVVLRRPDPQAVWRPRRPEEWRRAHLAFEREASSGGKRGTWRVGADAPAVARGPDARWTVAWRGLASVIRPTPFKHVGLFPEQAVNWDWIEHAGQRLAGSQPALLNLFGYTGTASLVAARAGFRVTHVDASRSALAWTRENLAAAGLPADALRLVLDDARAFAQREARRGARYAGLVLDPPHHGRGPKGEEWQFEDHAAELVACCLELLEARAFLCFSTYAIGFSPIALANLLEGVAGARVAADELVLAEEGPASSTVALPPRFLPAGACARLVRGLDLDP